MSWLAHSIAHSLRIDDHDEQSTSPSNGNNHSQFVNDQNLNPQEQTKDEEEGELLDNQGREGVKEDLSEFTETLTRQLWGVASFLAPPPPQQHSETTTFHHQTDWDSGDFSDEDASNSIDNQEVVAGRFGGGISNLSNFQPIRSEDQIRDDAVGVTEEALAFARNIAHHPETWLDFPLSEEDDTDDFDMSDTQWSHATAVERRSPRLAALRIELCPTHMSESFFWMVYFILLHSRLNKHDAERLSTPQMVEARAMWMKELQKQTKPETEWLERSASHTRENSNSNLQEDFNPSSSDFRSGNMSQRAYAFESTNHFRTPFETQKHPIVSSENQIIDKSVIKEDVAGPSYKIPPIQDFDDDGDDWLHEHSDLEDGYNGPAIDVGTDEDVSFSDLEADDDCTMPIKSNTVSNRLNMSTKTL